MIATVVKTEIKEYVKEQKICKLKVIFVYVIKRMSIQTMFPLAGQYFLYVSHACIEYYPAYIGSKHYILNTSFISKMNL